jgi:hypothetical protein
MVMYSFVRPFREAKFWGVPSCVFDELGCAPGEKMLRNTAVDECQILLSNMSVQVLPIPFLPYTIVFPPHSILYNLCSWNSVLK